MLRVAVSLAVAACLLACAARASEGVKCNPAFRAKELIGLYNQRRFTEYAARYSAQAVREDNGTPFFATDGAPLTSTQLSCGASKGVWLWLAHSADVLTVHHEKTTSRSDEKGWRARFVETKPPKEMPTARLQTTLYFNGKPLELAATFEFNHHCKVVKESFEYDAVSPAFASILLGLHDCLPTVDGNADDGAGASANDVVHASPSHSAFDALVRRTGLTRTLADGDVTVFAPSNDAVRRVQGELAELSDAALADFVRKHVVGRHLLKADLVANGNTEYDSVSGAKLHVSVEDDMVFIGRAKIDKADVLAKNGVVHYVDHVIA